MEKYTEFIKQTANDYDMNIDDVQRAYDENGNSLQFYDKLESILERRCNGDEHE